MKNVIASSVGYEKTYHDRQFVEPYQSTIAFCDWLSELGVLVGRNKICDLGCGKGANTYYMSKRFPKCHIVGADIDKALIRDGNEILLQSSAENCQLMECDIYKVAQVYKPGEFDGVVSFQTLSWLPDYKEAINAITSISPKWIALTSLFYDGPIEAKIVITEFNQISGQDRSLFYNTYSLPMVKKHLNKCGYRKFEFKKFEMPIDLPRGNNEKMGTYTERTIDGKRLQISGPLLMNWYFIFAAVA